MTAVSTRQIPSLPWWTWVVPLPVFILGYQISAEFRSIFGSSIVYLPITLGIVLVHWWGPRVLTPLYLTSIFLTQAWSYTVYAPLIATHDTVCVFASWLLYRKVGRGDCRLENVQELVKFLMLGVLIPICINSLYYPFIFRVPSENWPDYWRHVSFLLLSDFTTCFAIIVPLLFFLTPLMDRLGLTLRYSLVDRHPDLKT